MNVMLLRSCATLWLVGLLVMWFARAVLVLEPRALLFQLAAGLWILGGLGYTGLAVHALVLERPARSARGPEPADLSSWIRRR